MGFFSPQLSQMPSPVPQQDPGSMMDQLKRSGHQLINNLYGLTTFHPDSVVPFTAQTDPGSIVSRSFNQNIATPIQNAYQQAQGFLGGIFGSPQTVSAQKTGPSPTPTIDPRNAIAAQLRQRMSQLSIPTTMPTVTPTPTQTASQSADLVNTFRFLFGQPTNDAEQQLRNFYTNLKNPPLSQYIPDFVTAGKKYGVDPRILAYVGQIESSGGINYPTDTFNPFGYLVNGGGAQGLKNAGFSSVPNAIDALTHRFATNQYPGYVQFRNEPSVSNLQIAYNANPAERNKKGGYLDLAPQLLQYLSSK